MLVSFFLVGSVSSPRVNCFLQVLTFYIVMPLTIGFIVQSYMAAQMPGSEAGTPAFSTTRQTSGGSDSLSLSRRSYAKKDGEGGVGEGGMEAIQENAVPGQGSDGLSRGDSTR